MNFRKALFAVLLLPAASLEAQTYCELPGELLLEDPAGDAAISTPGAAIPVPSAAHDIISLHAAENTDGKLTFTYKIASLASLPPQTAYILRLQTDIPPANGDQDYFVAMLTRQGSPIFVYGTDGFQFNAPAGEPRQFRIVGNLDASSKYNADGTITLVLDKTALPGLEPGMFVFNILPTTRLVTPANAPAPFFTNADNTTIIDDVIGSGFYEISGDCAAGRSSVLGAGAIALTLLLPFGLMALRRR